MVVNTKLLKGKLKEKGMTQEDAARIIGVDPSTFNRKINNESGDVITVMEAGKIAGILSIPKNELGNIFFAEKLAETQE